MIMNLEFTSSKTKVYVILHEALIYCQAMNYVYVHAINLPFLLQ